MNDIDKIPVKCRDCPYWEFAKFPWCCGDCKDRMKKPVSDFVSRQWLIDEYHRRHEGPSGGALKMIEEAPAVDAVPVVRCKECRYWEKVEYYPDGYKMCCRLLRAEMHGECFCSLGTRKEKEDAE